MLLLYPSFLCQGYLRKEKKTTLEVCLNNNIYGHNFYLHFLFIFLFGDNLDSMKKKWLVFLLLLSPSGLSLGFYGLHMVVLFWFVDVF